MTLIVTMSSKRHRPIIVLHKTIMTFIKEIAEHKGKQFFFSNVQTLETVSYVNMIIYLEDLSLY